jgi:Protein of unknown function (DUF4239)
VNSIVVSSIAFACVFGGALIAMRVRRRLPAEHLSADSKEVVKLGMGLIASLAALVLGLLIATSKGTYDSQSNAVKELAAKVILLEGILTAYGPETKDVRDLLRSAITATEERLWPTDGSQRANLTPGESKAALGTMVDKISVLSPQNDAQRALRSRALDGTADLASARIRLFAQQDSSLPVPLLVVLVFWLTILFSGYGILAPSNATVVTMLLVCALSVSAAIFLMLELATPFTGTMRVSNAPLLNALSLLGQ